MISLYILGILNIFLRLIVMYILVDIHWLHCCQMQWKNDRPALSLSDVTIFRIKWKGNDICMPECVNLSRELSQVDLYLNCTDLISSRHGDFLHKMSSKWINMSLKCRLSKCPSIPIMLCSVCVRIGSQGYVLVLLWFRDSQSFVFKNYEWKSNESLESLANLR